jgi:hypothetical protein
MAVTHTPASPLADDEVTLDVTATTGTAFAYELTAVPESSALATGLLLSSQYAGDPVPGTAAEALERGLATDVFTPDAPGVYSVTCHEYTSTLGQPSYQGDPAGEDRYIWAATQTGTVSVLAEVDLPIVTERGDGATLRMGVNSTTILTAELVDHTTEAAREAAIMAGPVAALAGLVGIALDVAGEYGADGNSLQNGANDLRTHYEAHRVLVGAGPCHPVADATNRTLSTACNSQVGAIALLNRLRQVIVAHCRNGSAAAANWHNGDDLFCTLLAPTATNTASATVLSADLRWRIYERHRVLDGDFGPPLEPFCHTTEDVTNPLTYSISKLDTLIAAYLDALAIVVATAPAGEPPGAVSAWHRYGFVRRTL